MLRTLLLGRTGNCNAQVDLRDTFFRLEQLQLDRLGRTSDSRVTHRGRLAIAREIDLARDQSLFAAGESIERMTTEDRDIRLLADLDRTEAVGQTQLLRGVECDRLQCRVGRHVAVTNRLRRFEVEVANQFPVVALDDRVGSRFVQQRGVVRNRVEGFHLVGPPVGERTATGPMLHDLGRDLVALQHMLQRPDTDAMTLGHTQQHQNFVGAIAVRVNEFLMVDDVSEGFET